MSGLKLNTCPICFNPFDDCECPNEDIEDRIRQMGKELIKSRLERIEKQMVEKASEGAFKEADKLLEQKKKLIKQLADV